MIRHLLLGLWLTGTTAQAAEYREVHLTDGRVIKAEIKGFTPDAITLGLKQGTMIFKPQLLERMEPLTEAEFHAQTPWRVAILNFTASSREQEPNARTAHMLASRALSEIPGVVSGTPADIPGDIRQSDRLALSACRTDLLCAVRKGEAAGVDVVMMGQIREANGHKELRLGALWVNAPAARKRVSIKLTGSPVDQRQEIYSSQHALLSIEPPSDTLAAAPVPAPVAAPTPQPVKPVVRRPPEPRKPMSDATLRAMAWAPIPGLPHLARGDNTAFAQSLAIAGVGTAAGIGMAGKAAYTKPQFIAASVLSTYTFTAMANHLFWPRKAQPPPK